MLSSEQPAMQSLRVLPFLRARTVPSLPLVEEPRPTQPIPAANAPEPSRDCGVSRADDLAHDVRNLLASIELIAGLLAEPGVLARENAHYAAQLESSAQALAGLVGNLAALGSGQTPGPKNNISIDQLAQQASSEPAGELLTLCGPLLRATAGHRVQVYLSYEQGLPSLGLTSESFRRIMINLVRNAAEAMAERGGTIRITARRALSRTSPAVLFHIVDDGAGIPAHALQSIFSRGWSSKGSGRGMGLAIVKELVDDIGGEVRVASTRRRGTTFELRIPAASV